MTAQTFSFSRNIHFTGLDPASPGPQPATLVWEIDNDPTLLAGGIIVRNDAIDVSETVSETPDDGTGDGPDQIVSFEINRVTAGPTYTPTAWLELTQAERDAFLAVFAAHQGKVTRRDAQIKVDNAATTNPDFNPWVEKLSITTEPLKAGLYIIEASCEHKLTTAPVNAGNDRSEVRLQIDFGAGSQNRGFDGWPHDFAHATHMIDTYNAREGETFTVSLEHRRIGAGMISEIKRARLSVTPVDGTES